ncbi:phosphopantetheine-binding protein [Desulfovibrio sp. OttesenSCG-928-C06]|nr:phosphopantetheine-binding protein [Desulfovibrio sp. OttesenSCG-928-C06]
MTRDVILDKLKKAIVEELYLEDVTEEDLSEDMVLFGEGLGLDSIDAVELVVIVEKHFGVAVKNADEAKTAFASLGVLASFIEERLAG